MLVPALVLHVLDCLCGIGFRIVGNVSMFQPNSLSRVEMIIKSILDPLFSVFSECRRTRLCTLVIAAHVPWELPPLL